MSERVEFGIGIGFNSDATTQNNLKKALEDLQKKISGKMDLKVDLNFDNKNIAKLSQQLEDVSSKLMAVNNIGFSKVQSNFESLQDTMDGFKVSSISETIIGDETVRKVTTLKNELNQVQKIIQTKGENVTYVNTDNIEKQEKALLKMETRIESAKEKFNLLSKTGNFDTDYIDELQSRLNTLNTDSAEEEIKAIENELKNLSKSSNQITTLNKTIDNLTIKYKALQDNKSVKMDTDNAVASAKNLESEINKLKLMRDELSNGKFFDGSQVQSQVNKASSAFTELKGNVEKVNNTSKTFASTLQNVGVYISAFTAFNTIKNVLKDSADYILQLDNAMVELNKVLKDGETISSGFMNNVQSMSKELGSSGSDIIQSISLWERAGENLQDSQELANTTIVSKFVGDETDVETAQKHLIAPMTAFKKSAEETIQVVDELNNVSNNMATDYATMGEALSRSASSMATAGNTMEQTIALIGTAESKTKLGGEVIGSAFKTISLRIAEMKDEEGNLIPKMAETLQQYGVEMTDAAGQMRSTFDIFMDLGKVWNSLSRNQQLDLSEMLGGKR